MDTTAAPHLANTDDNRKTILDAIARTWTQRCSELGLKLGTKGLQRELEAFLQGAIAALTCCKVVSHDEAARWAFIVAIGRAEELVAGWNR